MSNNDQNEDLKEIIEKFERALLEGKALYLDSEDFEDLAEFYMFRNNIDKAQKAVEMAVNIHSDNPKLIALQIALHLDAGNKEEARRLMEKAKDNPALPIQLIYSEMLSAEGKNDEAQHILTTLKNEIENEDECIEIGYSCLDTGREQMALYWFKRSIQINPDSAEGITGLCETYQSMGEYEKTIELFNKLLDKDPYNAENWVQLGRSYFALEKYDNAIDASEFAIISDETFGEAYLLKGYAFLQLKNYEEANKAYLKAWRLGALESHLAFMLVGFNFMEMKMWDMASKYLLKSLEKAADESLVLPDIYINLSASLIQEGKHEEAHTILTRMQSRLPNNIAPFLYNGKHYLKEGDYERAFVYFNRALELNGSDIVWFVIGIMAVNTSAYQVAHSIFEGLQTDNTDINALKTSIQHMTEQLDSNGLTSDDKKLLLTQLNRFFDQTEPIVESSATAGAIPSTPLANSSENVFLEIKLLLDELTEMMETYEIEPPNHELN